MVRFHSVSQIVASGSICDLACSSFQASSVKLKGPLRGATHMIFFFYCFRAAGQAADLVVVTLLVGDRT